MKKSIKVITIEDSLDSVFQKCNEEIPEVLWVVNKSGVLVGCLLHSDFEKALTKKEAGAVGSTIGEVLREFPAICEFEDEAFALKIMRSNKTSFLPVVNVQQQLAGIISFVSLARSIINCRNESMQWDKLHT